MILGRCYVLVHAEQAGIGLGNQVKATEEAHRVVEGREGSAGREGWAGSSSWLQDAEGRHMKT